MKNSQKYCTILLWILFFLPFVNYTIAIETEDYVGINENEEYKWLIELDEDLYKDLENDAGSYIYNEEEDKKIQILQIEEDRETIKIKILNIDGEKKYLYGDGVKVEYLVYYKENYTQNEWEAEDRRKKVIIYNYDRDNIFNIYQLIVFNSVYVVGTNVEWDEVADEINDELDGYGEAKYKNNEFCAEIYDHENEIKKIEVICKYNIKGVLEFYEYKYDGDVLFRAELDESLSDKNIMILIPLIIISLIVLTVLISIIIKKRKYKRKLIEIS